MSTPVCPTTDAPLAAPPSAPRPTPVRSAGSSSARSGLLFALAAYGWWGLLPLYLDLFRHLPPVVVLAHRVVWSVVFLAVVLTLQGRWGEVAAVVRRRRTLGLLAVGGGLIAVNWYVFIYAVSVGQVLQGSLGYYINPLISVLLAMVVLGERLRPGQWVSLALAGGGVVVLAAGGLTSFPWIALTLAMTFALYGLLRKLVPVGPIVGLMVETAVLAPAAVVLLAAPPAGLVADLDQATLALLVLSGVATALPLLWFASAARRLRLSTLGFLQYVGPTLQFLVAVTVLGEPLDGRRLLAFGFIWAALAVYTLESLRSRRQPIPPVEVPE